MRVRIWGWGAGLLLEGVEALGAERDFLTVAADEIGSEFGFLDVADDVDVLDWDDFLVVFLIDGEEEFVVLSAIEGAGNDIEVHLLGHGSRLVVDWEFVGIDGATHLALSADVQEFAGESVRDIHH